MTTENTSERPNSELSMTINADGDSVLVSFTGFERGSTVLRALMYLTSQPGVEALAQEFYTQGDLSFLEFIKNQASAQ